tara:strand:+ start:511 stop:999 length:489 start_codon:yes stop_codon:yes gene_type:complete
MSKTPHDHFFMDDEDLEDELSSGQTGEGSEDERGDGRGLSDLLRKAMTGVGAVMTNDEGVRDYRVTNNAMRMLGSTAEKTKREVTEVVTKEVRNFLDHLELHEIITRVMTGMTFEIHTKIKMIPNEQGKPEMEITQNDVSINTRTDAAVEDTDDGAQDPNEE